MSAEVALESQAHARLSRLEREAIEVEAAIALVAQGAQYRVLLCGLRYGGQLAASRAARAAAAGVHLETVRRSESTIEIRVCPA
jgi:hypothetical protein